MHSFTSAKTTPASPARSAGRRFTALAITASVMLISIVLPGALRTQPVPINPITPQTFQATDFDAYFNTAEGSASQGQWEALIDQGKFVLAAQWEANIDAQIANEVSAVTHTDYFNTVAEYKDYLLSEYKLQKQTAFAAWEQAAELEIETQRETFLAALSAKQKQSAEQDSDQALDQAHADPTDITAQQTEWEDEFADAIENGFNQFQSALANVHSEYMSFLATLEEQEQEFEYNRLQIEAYEQTVRDGIQQTVYSLDSYLQSNGLFHKETCVAAGAPATQTQTCTTDMNAYNNAGTNLQQLIQQLQDGLDQDVPLSVLAQTMNDYLETEHQAAIDRRDYWGGQIRNSYTYWKDGIAANGNPYANGEVQNILNARSNGYTSFDGLKTMIAANGDPRIVESVANADIQGYSHSYSVHPDQVGHSGDGEWYSSSGDAAFRFNWEQKHEYWYVCGIYWCKNSYTSHHTADEQYVRLRIDYNWYDANADANHQIWSGYVNDINPVLGHWRDNILPAIQNWEAQVATYTANHQAYLADAQTKRADALDQYNTSINTLVDNRNKWLSQMTAEYRKGRNEWVSLGKTTSAASLDSTAIDAIRSATNTAAGFAGLREEHLAAAAPALDFNALANLQTAFQKSTQGIMNLALASTLNDDVVDQRKKIIASTAANVGANSLAGLSNQRVRELASQRAAITGESVDEAIAAMRKDADERQYTVSVGANGKIIATRQIKSGAANGEGSSADGYSAALTEQRLEIAPPPAVKLVKTAGAFDAWDYNTLVGEHFDNQKNYVATLENYNGYLQGELETADKIRENNEKIYQANVEAKMLAASNSEDSFGSFIKAVGMTMMGGASFGDAMMSVAHDEWAGEAARLTGIPMNFFSSVLAGGSWRSALTDATEYLVEDYATNAIAEATGLPVGFLGGMVNGSSIDMSPATMKAAFQNYTNALWSEKLEEQTGIPGLGALVMERMAKNQNERERVDLERQALIGNPLAGTKYLLKHTPFGRELTDQALGYMSGRTLGNAMGLPPAMMNPMVLTGMAMPGMGAVLGTSGGMAMGGLMPADSDDLWDMVGDVENVANRRVDGRDLEEKYRDKIDLYVAENEAALNDLKSLSLSDIPGRFGQAVTGYLSGAMGMIMKPLTALTNPPDKFSPAELAVRESLATQVALATGQNAAYLMAVARGESYEDAAYAQAYDDAATSIYGDSIPPEYRAQVVGLVRDYTENTLERLEFQRQRERAANDPLNIWRGAAYGSADQRAALQVAEIGAGAAATVFGGPVGAAAFITYMSAKQGYMAFLDTGDQQAAWVGLASGAANGALGYATSGMANMSLTYTPEDGFGGTVGLGYEKDGLSAGANLSWQEGVGITGAGMNGGVRGQGTYGPQPGGSLALNFDADGTFQGGNIAGSFSGDTDGGNADWTGSLGLNFGGDLSYTGVTANFDTGWNNKNAHNGAATAYSTGLGLTFNSDGTSNLNITQGVAFTNAHKFGFNGAGVNVSNDFSFGADGTFVGTSQNIKFDIKSQTKEQATQQILDSKQQVTEEMQDLERRFANSSPEERAAIRAQYAELEQTLNNLDVLHKQADIKYARYERAIEKLRDDGKEEELAQLLANPDLLDDDDFRDEVFEGEGNGGNGESYSNALTQFFGEVAGGIQGLFGFNDDGDGWVDEQGVYHERTCFVAGTLVRVAPQTRGAFAQHGDWYKRIEEIEIGDHVLSWNEDSAEISYQQVTQTFVRETDLIYTISYEDGTQVETTWNHPFYIANRGWVDVKDLRTGEVSLTANTAESDTMLAERGGATQTAAIAGGPNALRIARITTANRAERVYNFEVHSDHTYFVPDEDVLVHNQAGRYANEEKWANYATESEESRRSNIINNIVSKGIQQGKKPYEILEEITDTETIDYPDGLSLSDDEKAAIAYAYYSAKVPEYERDQIVDIEFSGPMVYGIRADGTKFIIDEVGTGSPDYDGVDAAVDIYTFGGYTLTRTVGGWVIRKAGTALGKDAARAVGREGAEILEREAAERIARDAASNASVRTKLVELSKETYQKLITDTATGKAEALEELRAALAAEKAGLLGPGARVKFRGDPNFGREVGVDFTTDTGLRIDVKAFYPNSLTTPKEVSKLAKFRPGGPNENTSIVIDRRKLSEQDLSRIIKVIEGQGIPRKRIIVPNANDFPKIKVGGEVH